MRYGYYGIVDITDMTLHCTGTLVLITEITVSSLSTYILQKIFGKRDSSQPCWYFKKIIKTEIWEIKITVNLRGEFHL